MISVSQDEAGQKLVRFIARRLGLPDSMLHRWIRQGQVRLNGRRVKAFTIVNMGDEIRLPPFAFDLAAKELGNHNGLEPGSGLAASLSCNSFDKSAGHKPFFNDALPPLVAAFPDFIVFNKPAGLPAHGGTGHSKSLASLIEANYAGRTFKPTLAHRLDKDTSGLIVVALSYTSLRRLHEAFLSHALVKEYVAWVQGKWQGGERIVLRHWLKKMNIAGKEKVCAVVDPADSGKEALTMVSCLKTEGGASLLHLRIMTGRTHQIRAQLAAEGHPLIGDLKYGAKPPAGLFLHAARIIMPDGTPLECLPPWEGPRALKSLPEPL